MADIFLSYARPDQSRVEVLADRLMAAGFSVWWDRHLRAGGRYAEQLESELNAASIVLVAWTPASVASDWVRDEASVGRDKGNLLPIILAPVTPPLGFRQLQALDLSQWNGEGSAEPFERLTQTVNARLRGADAEHGQPLHKEGAEPAGPVGTSSARPSLALTFLILALVVGMLTLLWFASGDQPHNELATATQPEQASASQGVSLAVLPFASFSDDPEQGYFADGLTEELLNWLGNVEGLRVPGRTSSFRYKNLNLDLRVIGEQLDVSYVLEGSVRAGSSGVRITAQLIEANSGYHLWSKAYDRAPGNLLEIQDDIARLVVTELLGELPPDLTLVSGMLGDVDAKAHELYLIGRAHWVVRDDPGAYAALLAATQIDPEHWLAQAYLAIVIAKAVANNQELSSDDPVTSAQADQALAKAVAVRPDAADVVFARGWLLDMRSGITNSGRVVDQQSIDLYRETLRRNPRHSEALHALARADISRSEQIALFEKTLRFDPALTSARINLANAYMEMGKPEKARAALASYSVLVPDAPNTSVAYIAKLAGSFETSAEATFSDWEITQADTQARRLRAALLADLGATEAAAFLYRQESQRTTGFPLTNAIGAAMLEQDRAKQLELARMQQALERPPQWSGYMLAQAFAASGQPQQALAILTEQRPDLLSDAPRYSAAGWSIDFDQELHLAASVMAQIGRPEQARRLWQVALESKRRDSVGIWYQALELALLNARLGDKQRAIDLFDQGIELGFRFPYSLPCSSCVSGILMRSYGAFSYLRSIPEIQRKLDALLADNAALLQDFERRYGVLARIDELKSQSVGEKEP